MGGSTTAFCISLQRIIATMQWFTVFYALAASSFHSLDRLNKLGRRTIIHNSMWDSSQCDSHRNGASGGGGITVCHRHHCLPPFTAAIATRRFAGGDDPRTFLTIIADTNQCYDVYFVLLLGSASSSMVQNIKRLEDVCINDDDGDRACLSRDNIRWGARGDYHTNYQLLYSFQCNHGFYFSN